jgi:hypothetical protein
VNVARPSAVIAMALLVGACTASTTAAPQPTAPINTLGPTATLAPTTPATARPEPAAAYTPDEQAAIAALDRYIALGAAAQGIEPGPAALDVESYAGGELAKDFRQTLEVQMTEGIRRRGSANIEVHSAVTRPDRAIVLSGCLTTDMSVWSREGTIQVSEATLERTAIRARIEFFDSWLPVAVERSDEPFCNA